MSINHGLAAILAALAPAALAPAQSILTTNGTPDPSYPTFYAWFSAASGLNGSATPLADGTIVTSWDDLTPNQRNLTRVDASATRNPVAHDRLESCGPAVYFDGDDYIWAASSDPFGRLSNPRTIFVVTDAHEIDRGYVFDSSTRSGRTALFTGQTQYPDVWNVYWGDNQGTSNLLVGPAIETHRNLIHTILLDTNLQEYSINSNLVASDTQPAIANLGGIVLGNRYNLALGLTGYIREILIYEEALSPSNRQLIEAYLMGTHPLGYGASYGNSCAGSGGFSPQISAVGCPSPGATFELRLEEALGGAVATYFFGLSRVSIPLGPCEWSVGQFLFTLVPGATTGSGPGAGTQSLPMSIPGYISPGSATVQAAILDAGAAPFGATFSNGLEIFWL